MNIKLIVISKTDQPYLQEGIDIYVKRLRHYTNFEIDVIPALKDQKGASPEEIKEREAALLLKRLEGADRIILLDEHGKEHTSVGFSQYLQKQMNAGTRTLAGYLLHRTTEIDVNEVGMRLLYDTCSIGHCFWFASVDLDSHRPLFVMNSQFARSGRDIPHQGISIDELRIHTVGSVAFTKHTKRRIRDILHRGQI